MPSTDPDAAQLLSVLRSVLGRIAEPAKLLKTILALAVEKTGADRGVFVEVDRGGDLQFRVLYRFELADFEGERESFSRGVFREVLSTGRPVRLDNAVADPAYGSRASVQDFGLVSVLCSPIRAHDRIAGLVHLQSDRAAHFEARHEALLDSLLTIAGPALAALDAGEKALRESQALRAAAEDEAAETRRFLSRNWSFGRFVGRSAPVRALGVEVEKASRTASPVLILGETGTGKSLVARVVHHAGDRRDRPFVTVFCPALEKGTVETELFGHRRGAFTGAVSDRIGKVQSADGGTLFLDEIGDLPADIQSKLLRLLQERTFERVGDPREYTADVRVVAATNRDLELEIRERRFRRDLYERLNFLPIRIPPLRERREDLPTLLRHCLDQHSNGRWVELSAEADALLQELDFAWPGNVRHLEQLAARLVADEPKAPVTPQDVRRLLGTDTAGASGDDGPSIEEGLPALLAHAERSWIAEALRRYPELSRKALAEKLKISPSALYKKLSDYDLA